MKNLFSGDGLRSTRMAWIVAVALSFLVTGLSVPLLIRGNRQVYTDLVVGDITWAGDYKSVEFIILALVITSFSVFFAVIHGLTKRKSQVAQLPAPVDFVQTFFAFGP